MNNIQEHIISKDASVRQALEMLNKLPKTLTLFALNEKNQLVGTLTDGDIRRGFINNKTLDDPVNSFLTSNFHYLDHNQIDVKKIKEIKAKGIKLLPVLNEQKEIIKIYDLQKVKSILPLCAVIMAGGKGERLAPITNTIPKPMILLGNRPIIEHNIDRLISFGIEKIYISVNYLKDQIIDYFGDGSKKGIEIEYIHEDKPLGTAGALSLISNFTQDILLLNSDLFTNIDYEDLYLTYIEQKANLAIASTPYTVNIPYAILRENENVIQSFKEKPTNTHYANAGIYIIQKDLIKSVPKNTFYNATDLLQNTLDKKLKVVHNPIVGYWIDIGKHEDLVRAKDIAKHIKND